MSRTQGTERTASLQQFKPYLSYKDSGVEWLGEVPAHWDLRRLRSTLTGCQNGVWGDEPDGLEDVPCIRVADFDRVAYRVNLVEPTLRSIDQRLVQTRRLNAGDLLLEKSGGGENQPVGAVVLYDHKTLAVCSNFIARMKVAEGFVPRFLTYLHAALYAARINTRSIKQSTGIQNLDSASYLSEIAAFPGRGEQHSIADFLDRETAKIAALVAKKERLIELLQEKRTALITRGVTKGLDPSVPMKDSGVTWLGKIPNHWETTPLKRLVSFIGGGTPSKDVLAYWLGEIPWISPKDMRSRIIIATEDKITEEAIQESATRVVPEGTVVLVVRSGILNHSIPVAITGIAAALNQDLKALVSRGLILPEYLAAVIEGHQPPLLLEWRKEGATVESLEVELIENSRFPLPPLEEQRAICRFLNQETEKIDELVGRIRQGTARLKEYRTALISAAVTGKIDVRGKVS